MPKPARATFHHGALRDALLKQAAALLDKEGVDAVTIRAVARNAGVSHAAPVNHFATRGALMTALATSFFRDLNHAIEAKIRKARRRPRERIRAFAEALLEFGLRHPHRYRLLWRRDVLDDDTELQLAMDAIYDRLITEISGAGPMSGKSPHTIAIAMWSLVHGYVSLRLDGMFESRRDEATGQSRFDAMLDLVTGCLGSASA
jgi:AcrR family transcriptional regulator